MINIYTIHCVVAYVILLCIIIVVVITTQPMNVTVCLTQSTTASFTCVVDGGGIPIASAGWEIRVGERSYIPVVGINRHMVDLMKNGDIITDTLTVTSVSVNDNDAQYRCEPISNVNSDVVILTVLGMCVYVIMHTVTVMKSSGYPVSFCYVWLSVMTAFNIIHAL